MTAGGDLREVQTLLWRLITAPEGVARGLEVLRHAGTPPGGDLDALLRPSPAQSPVERLDVYADMYFYRLRDALTEDYPNLARWLGPRRFHNLVTDYLLAHPSRHFSLRELGRALPSFLAGHPLAVAFPRAPGLAALEWARVDVFDEADADPLSREALLGHAAAGPERCPLALVPAARLVRLDPGVLPLWRRLEDGAAAPAAPAAPATSAAPAELPEAGVADGVPTAVVWRRGHSVLHRGLAEDEARCLAALVTGAASLAAVAERLLAGPDAPAEAAGLRFGALLDRWTADGLLRLARPPPPVRAGPVNR